MHRIYDAEACFVCAFAVTCAAHDTILLSVVDDWLRDRVLHGHACSSLVIHELSSGLVSQGGVCGFRRALRKSSWSPARTLTRLPTCRHSAACMHRSQQPAPGRCVTGYKGQAHLRTVSRLGGRKHHWPRVLAYRHAVWVDSLGDGAVHRDQLACVQVQLQHLHPALAQRQADLLRRLPKQCLAAAGRWRRWYLTG